MERRLCISIGYAAVTMCLAAQVAGCAHPKQGGPDAAGMEVATGAPTISAEIRSSDSVEALVHYGALLRSISAEASEQEYAQFSDVWAHDASAPNRIRLGLLLSLPGASFRNNARARDCFEQVLDDSGYNAGQYRSLARLLLAMLDERSQLDGALADERRQRHELQQQLDQLKAIEQDTGTRIPPKPMKER